jgi:glycosyltransferase 2 family protein
LLGVLLLAGASFSAFHYGAWVLLAVVALVAALIIVIEIRPLCEGLLGACQRVTLLKGIAGGLRQAYEAAYGLLRPRPLLIGTILGTVAWLCECLAFFFVCKGFGLGTSLPLATFIYAFASLAGAASMIPGGLGVAEGSLTGLLMLSGAARGDAASATIIVRLCTLWFAVLIGLAASLKLKDKI